MSGVITRTQPEKFKTLTEYYISINKQILSV